MKGRALVLASAAIALTLVTPRCSPNGVKPMLNKSPTVETIRDAGVKQRPSMSEPVEKKKKSKLDDVVPKPVEPKVMPVPDNPFVAPTEETPEESKKEAETGKEYKWPPLPLKSTKRSDYKPWEDKRPLYPVDDAGVRLDKKEKKKHD